MCSHAPITLLRRPNVIKQVQYLWKRLSTLQSTPAGASGAH